MGWGTAPNPVFVADAAKSVGLPISAAGSAILLIFFSATLGMLNLAGALGEEIGWRGFLVPALFELTHRNFTTTVLINAVIWACWHAPLIFFSSYNNPGVPRWYSFGCFVILNIGGAAIVDWFRLRSGSLWTGVLLHNSHNIFVQVIFTPLTVNTGKTQYFIDEFGIVLPLIMLAFGVYFWTRRKELTNFPPRISGRVKRCMHLNCCDQRLHNFALSIRLPLMNERYRELSTATRPVSIAYPIRGCVPRYLLPMTFVGSRVGDVLRNHVAAFVPTSDVRRHLVTAVRIIAFDSSGCDIRRIAVAGSRIRGRAVQGLPEPEQFFGRLHISNTVPDITPKFFANDRLGANLRPLRQE